MPTVDDVEAARRAFIAREPRHLFYRVAIELIDLSLRGATKITVPEALAVLLQTWNKTFYRFRLFDEHHFHQIEKLVQDQAATIAQYRERSIRGFTLAEGDALKILFIRFEDVLGPVGAAKTLHLLAPSFFPLWDRAIAKAYHVNLNGGAHDKYINFMRIAHEQCRLLEEQGAAWPDPLKALDEYNYCAYTLKAELD